MKKVVITGASRGIGRSVAEKFLAEGWNVIATSTHGTGWVNKNLTWVALDLAEPESIATAAEKIISAGTIDALINNAGIVSKLEDDDFVGQHVVIAALREMLEVNLIGTIDLTERLSGHFNKGGHIVSLGSRLGSISDAESSYAPSYAISKAALSMYTRRLAARLKPNVTVSIINPGWVQTDMGGSEAPRKPVEVAEEIYELVTGNFLTGQFWYRGTPQAW
jgi:NAD(P)-dependent dehydrogenase (short-subunit alcohol dehydrogenase family)